MLSACPLHRTQAGTRPLVPALWLPQLASLSRLQRGGVWATSAVQSSLFLSLQSKGCVWNSEAKVTLTKWCTLVNTQN